MTAGSDRRLTTVRSRLLLPDGEPAAGKLVRATILAPATWLADRTGRVVSLATGSTNPDGWWSLDLTPCPQMEMCDQAYYEIQEGSLAVTYAHVPDQNTPVLLRDIAIDQPPPIATWPVISTLGSLHNVSTQVDESPDGYVLVSDGSTWKTVKNLLAFLGDTDDASLALAQPGDVLTMLSNRKWGVKRDDPPATLVWGTSKGSTVNHTLVTVTSRNPAKKLKVTWQEDATPDIIDADSFEHEYEPGEHTLTISYEDGTEQSTDFQIIPWSAT
jgi:hypothetical protein